MRRIIQSTGVEVIHLGHDRSVEEVVNTAIQEDANAIAITPIREDITNILSTCMTCFKKRSRPNQDFLAVEVA
jgi:methylmalonyl-CoA mutase cobalamin-binding subunit